MKFIGLVDATDDQVRNLINCWRNPIVPAQDIFWNYRGFLILNYSKIADWANKFCTYPVIANLDSKAPHTKVFFCGGYHNLLAFLKFENASSSVSKHVIRVQHPGDENGSLMFFEFDKIKEWLSDFCPGRYDIALINSDKISIAFDNENDLCSFRLSFPEFEITKMANVT